MALDDICRTPKNMEVDLSEAFPGMNVNEACVNIVSKLADQGDQLQMDMQVESYIMTNGQPILYYPYKYNVDESEHITGEDLVNGYAKPFDIIAFIEVEDQPSWFASQGIDSDDTATLWIHIKTFKKKVKEVLTAKKDDRTCEYQEIYNLDYISQDDYLHVIEPKVGDLIQLTIYGCDREWDRGNKIFEITNKEDELFSQKFNLVGGHYVWRLTAKRFRYSHEEGISRLDDNGKDNKFLGTLGEKGNHQVYEHRSVYRMFLEEEGIETEDEDAITNENGDDLDTQKGRTTSKKEVDKVYDWDVDEESKKAIFDMEQRIPGYYNDAQKGVIANGWLEE